MPTVTYLSILYNMVEKLDDPLVWKFYSGDLRTGLVWYLVGWKLAIANWSGIQMPFEYWTKFSLYLDHLLIPNQYLICGLNKGPPFQYWTFEYWTNKNYLDVRFSDSHCIKECIVVKVLVMSSDNRNTNWIFFLIELKKTFYFLKIVHV